MPEPMTLTELAMEAVLIVLLGWILWRETRPQS
jgi:hypothetical protein